MRIYTPGHGLAADTLIMHGVVRYLALAGVTHGIVKRVGERYIIETQASPPKPAQLEAVRVVKDEVRMYLTQKKPAAIADLLLGKIYKSNINPSVFDKWIADMAQSLADADVEALTDPGHKTRHREGRTTSKALYTAYLTFTPMYGKYSIYNFVVYDNKKYGVCATCFAMLNLGLLYGTAVLSRSAGGDIDVILLTVAPAAEADIVDILILQRLAEGHATIQKDIPTLAAPLYWVSTGETLYAVETPIELLTWRIKRTGNFQRAVESATVNLSKLLDFVADLKWQSPRWPLCADALINTDNSDILADMTSYVLYGGDYYYIARKLTSALGDGRNGPRLKKVCEADKITTALINWNRKTYMQP